MNFFKNLVILALLAAVGYGVYVSLARNNVEPAPPPGVAEAWPAIPKVELPKPSSSPGGPLALGGTAVRPAPAIGASMGAGPPIGDMAPPFVSMPSVNPVRSPQSAAPPLTPVTPYPSSTSATASSAAPAAPTGMFASPAPATPAATLGPPTAPESQAPAAIVRNLAPPPEASQFNGGADAGLANNTAPAATKPTDGLLQAKFAAFMDAVQKNLDERRFADAHLALSKMYGNPDLPPEQAKQITDLLDRLAGTVIYSREHHLERAYVTQPGDTLDRLAQRYNVPWQLLARINGLMPPGVQNGDSPIKDQPLPVGMELKVVRGPFDAVVRLDQHELTLMVQNRYAGRFPIGVGRDQPKLDGEYTVRDKAINPVYYGPDGVTISPNDPKNPLGAAWIGLTDRIGIHGSNDPQAVGRDGNRGTICVSDRDLQDIYGILSVGSRVTILR